MRPQQYSCSAPSFLVHWARTRHALLQTVSRQPLISYKHCILTSSQWIRVTTSSNVCIHMSSVACRLANARILVNVCGGFPALWPNEPETDTLTVVESSNKYVLRTILESPYPGSNSTSSPDDRTAFDMVVKNYNSSMNVTAINNTNLDGIMQITKKFTELFPVEAADLRPMRRLRIRTSTPWLML
jgi:hypothetical protein